MLEGREPGQTATNRNDISVLLRHQPSLAESVGGEVGGQRAGLRSADRKPAERFQLVGERRFLGDALGLRHVFMHGPVDQRARNHAHHHDQALTFLPRKHDLIARRVGEVHVPCDQRLDVRSAAAGHGQVHAEAFLGKVALGLGEIYGRRRQRHHR